jgi:hypothetical protein
MTKRLTGALALEAVLIAALLTLALDMRAHNRVERLGGVNVWGYRGPVMHRKAANEIRIAVAGGDLAFGWGVAASETLVFGVRQLVAQTLDVRGARLHTFTAVDLGAIGLTPAEYAGWVQRFAYLRPDVVCLVPDARRHRTANLSVQPDRGSPIFRTFGYAPILPLVIEEKGAVMHSRMVRAAGSIAAALDRVGAVTPDPAGDNGRESGAAYVGAIKRAVQTALANGSAVVLVGPPLRNAQDAVDRDALAEMVTSAFGIEPRVRFIDLGQRADMADPAMWLDGAALSAAGHATAASHIVPDVVQLVRRSMS